MRSLLIGIALVVAGVIAMQALWSGPKLSVQASAPEAVYSGQAFRVRLRVLNPHDEAVTLDSINIDNSAFDTFEVLSAMPPPEDSPYSMFGHSLWSFYRELKPGERQSVEFELVANAIGTFQLPFDVCNYYQECSRILLAVRVDPAVAE
jgi:hypothetical protein